MTALLFSLVQQPSFFTVLGKRIEEGGTFIMSTILLSGLTAIILTGFCFYFLKTGNPKIKKFITLINSLGLFALVFGILGQVLGFIQIFDNIEPGTSIENWQVASGIKMSLLTVLFGAIIFLFTRFFTIVLTWLKKEQP